MEDQNLALVGEITRAVIDDVIENNPDYSVKGGMMILHLEDEDGEINVVTACNPSDYFYRAGLLREVEAYTGLSNED